MENISSKVLKSFLLVFLIMICISGINATDDFQSVDSDLSDFSSGDSDFSLDDVGSGASDSDNSDYNISINMDNNASDAKDNDLLNKTKYDERLSDSTRIHKLTDADYSTYFDEQGYLITTDVQSYDIFDLSGEFYERDFIFTLPVLVTSSNHDALLKESTIQFYSVNASFENHAKVSNLKINNSLNGINGVLLTNSRYVDIFDNDIYTTGASGNPVRLLYSNYSYVFNNKLETYYYGLMNGSWLHAAIILGDSHYNNLSSNDVTVKDSNGIYLSSYGVPSSNYNTIYNNTVRSSTKSETTGLPNPSSWSYGIQCMGDYNLILNNTVYNSYRGSSAEGHYNRFIGNIYFNITGGYIEGNDGTEGSDYCIFGSYDAIIANNTIYDSHFKDYAIYVGSGNTVYGNNIKANGGGIYLDYDSNDSNVFSNVIDVSSAYGICSPAQMSNLLIRNNTIFIDNGTAINILKRTKSSNPENLNILGNVIYSSNSSAILFKDLEDYVTLKDNLIYASIIVNNSTFFNYFEENGNLKALNGSIDYIIFKDLIDVNASISIDIPVKVLGKEAMLEDIQLNIKSDNVSIENIGFDFNKINTSLIYNGGFNNFKFVNNTVYSNFDNKSLTSNLNSQGLSNLNYLPLIYLSNVKNAEIYSNNIFSVNGILLNNSNADIIGNNINISSNYFALLSLNNSLINFSYNVVSVNGIFAINLTDTGSLSSRNNVSNNHLMRNNSQALVYYDDDCDYNNIIYDNFGIRTKLIAENDVAYINKNPVLILQLIDLNNNPLINEQIILKIKDSSDSVEEYNLTTDDNGMAILNYVSSSFKEGNYTFDVFYLANDPYKDSNLTNQKLEIKRMSTNLIASDKIIDYGVPILIEANLLGEDGSSLGAKIINLKIKSNDSKIIKELSNYTVNGLAQFNIGTLDIGLYSLEYSFEEDNAYIGSDASSSLQVNMMATKVDSKNFAMFYQNGSSIVAYLYDNQGKAVPNKLLSIAINGKTYKKTTNSQGKVSLTISLIPKKYVATIKFAGDENYKASLKSINVTVKTRTSKIVASNFVKYYKDSKRFVYYLKDSNNKPIASKSVSLTINGKTYKRTTDKNGKISILLNLKKKSYKATIKFSAKYYASASKKITYKVVYPVIKASSTSVKKGKKLNIVFKTYNNKVLKKERVYFKFKGKTYNLITTDKGIASLTCSMSKGSYKIIAGIKNTKTYGKYTRTISFKVK